MWAWRWQPATSASIALLSVIRLRCADILGHTAIVAACFALNVVAMWVIPRGL